MATARRVSVKFVDANEQLTNDYIVGWPSVWVNIEETFAPNFVRVPALVDTGSDATVIGPILTAGKQSLRAITSHNMRGAGFAGVYSALVQIDQLDKPYHIEVGYAAELKIRMILGRDMLSKYKLVMDTPAKEFYLEHVSV